MLSSKRQNSVSAIISKIIIGGTGIILSVSALSFLGLSFFSSYDSPDYYRVKTLALYAAGEVLLALLCYYVPESNPLEDFLFISFQCMAFSSAYIFIVVMFQGFPEYAQLNNYSSKLILVLCLITFTGFIKFRSNKNKDKRK